jgi:hypothetical protein
MEVLGQGAHEQHQVIHVECGSVGDAAWAKWLEERAIFGTLNESIQHLHHEEEEHGGQWVSLPEA